MVPLSAEFYKLWVLGSKAERLGEGLQHIIFGCACKLLIPI